MMVDRSTSTRQRPDPVVEEEAVMGAAVVVAEEAMGVAEEAMGVAVEAMGVAEEAMVAEDATKVNSSELFPC